MRLLRRSAPGTQPNQNFHISRFMQQTLAFENSGIFTRTNQARFSSTLSDRRRAIIRLKILLFLIVITNAAMLVLHDC
jgi:hypothetical protein